MRPNRPRTNLKQAGAGFTLIEVLIVVLIIGIIAAISVPKYGRSIRQYNAKLSAARLANDLKYASARARAMSQPVTMHFLNASDNDSGSYSFQDLVDPQRPRESMDVSFGSSSFGAQLDAGPATIIFDIYGYADQNAVWTFDQFTPSERTVTLDKAGSVSIQ